MHLIKPLNSNNSLLVGVGRCCTRMSLGTDISEQGISYQNLRMIVFGDWVILINTLSLRRVRRVELIRVKGVEGKRKQSWYLKQGSRGGCACGRVTSQAANGEAVSGGRARESVGSFRVTFASFMSAVNTFSGGQAAALTTGRWRRETDKTQEACDQPEAWGTWWQVEGEKTMGDRYCRTKKII